MNRDDELGTSPRAGVPEGLLEGRWRADRHSIEPRSRLAVVASVAAVLVLGAVAIGAFRARQEPNAVVPSEASPASEGERHHLCGAPVAGSADLGLRATVTLEGGRSGLPTDPYEVAGQLVLENTTTSDMSLVGEDAELVLIEDGQVVTTGGRATSLVGVHLPIAAGEQVRIPVYWGAQRCDDGSVIADLPDGAELRAVLSVSPGSDGWSMSEPIGP
jgi:hypothetical protein